jgi:hypothetical protein
MPLKGRHILLENDEFLRAKNSGGSPVNILKLNSSGKPEWDVLPEQSADASSDNQSVRKSQMDTALGLKLNSNDASVTNSRQCNNSFDNAATARSNLDVYSTGEVDAKVVGLYDHKGAYDADANSPDLDSSPSGVKKGDAYTVSVAGTFFTEALEIGDVIIADQDDPTQLSHWTRIQQNIVNSDGINEGSTNLFHTAQRARDALTFGKELNTLDATDVTNQYIDCAVEAKPNSVFIGVEDGEVGLEDYHYTISVEGSVTRITFAGPWASGGGAALISGDKLRIKYLKKDA